MDRSEAEKKLRIARRHLDKNRYDMSDVDYAKGQEMLKKAEDEYKGSSREIFNQDKHMVKGTPEKIKTGKFRPNGGLVNDIVETSADGIKKASRTSTLRKLARGFGKGFKALPIVGGLAAAMSSGDVSAAVPILGDASPTGPEKGTLERKLEDGTITPEEMERLKKQFEG